SYSRPPLLPRDAIPDGVGARDGDKLLYADLCRSIANKLANSSSSSNSFCLRVLDLDRDRVFLTVFVLTDGADCPETLDLRAGVVEDFFVDVEGVDGRLAAVRESEEGGLGTDDARRGGADKGVSAGDPLSGTAGDESLRPNKAAPEDEPRDKDRFRVCLPGSNDGNLDVERDRDAAWDRLPTDKLRPRVGGGARLDCDEGSAPAAVDRLLTTLTDPLPASLGPDKFRITEPGRDGIGDSVGLEK
ncbi:hypothetical protein HK104_001464, partial [Borealophlyctis nickersoniae]